MIKIDKDGFVKFATPKKDKVRYVASAGNYWVIVNPHSSSILTFRDRAIDESLSIKICRKCNLTKPDDLVKYNRWTTANKSRISRDEISDLEVILTAFPFRTERRFL